MIIGNRKISNTDRPYFIADIAANHDGDIQRAYKLIELAKEAGADCAKFQNFKAETIVSRYGFDSMSGQLSHQAQWKKSVYETYEDASLKDEWSHLLKEHCDKLGLEYMTSPYDYASVDLADQYVNAYKIGSGDITWLEIIEYMAKKGKPIILATGASTLKDVERAVKIIEKYDSDLVLMQCNTNYTASEENYRYINLNVLNTYREKFPSAILGLSDHTFGYATILGALALGARVFEKHFTDDNSRLGPDHKFSMNPVSWKEMVQAADQLYQALGDGVKRVEDNEKDTVNIQRRALYYKKDMFRGQVVDRESLSPLRPVREDSILPYELDDIVGKVLKRDVRSDDWVKRGDI